MATVLGPEVIAANDEHAMQLLPVMITFGIMAVLGVLGNVVVLFVYRIQFAQTSSTYLITWLAVLDLFTCAIGIPFDIVDIRYTYNFNNRAACKSMRFILYFPIITSAFLLTVIALIRYYKICKPLKRFPVRSTKIMIGLSFLVGLLFSWPALVLWGRNDIYIANINMTGFECSVEKEINLTIYPVVWFGILVIILAISVVFLIIFYSQIVLRLWRRKKTRLSILSPRISTLSKQIARNSIQNNKNDHREKSNSVASLEKKFSITSLRRNSTVAGYDAERTTMIFIVISLVFILSFLPCLVLLTLRKTSDLLHTFSNTSKDVAFNFFLRSYIINSVINPYIYGFFNPSFRRECWALVLKVKAKCSMDKSAKPLSTINGRLNKARQSSSTSQDDYSPTRDSTTSKDNVGPIKSDPIYPLPSFDYTNEVFV